MSDWALINQDSGKTDWATPKKLFEYFDDTYHFDLDPCSTHENALCKKHFTIEEDGLKQDWGGSKVFMNPPYSRETSKWIEKAYQESLKGAVVVCLIPCRPDASYWHKWIFPYASQIYFIQGRLHYSDSKETAPFPSAIVIFDKGVYDSQKHHLGNLSFGMKGGEFYGRS